VIRTRPRRPPRTPLGELARLVSARSDGSAADVEVTGITVDSRAVEPGDVYVAAPGASTHGARFAATAEAAGAVAVVSDEAGARLCVDDGVGVPVLVVDRPRDVLGALSSRVYGDPARSLRLVGVTGTQGKTTTTRLAEGALAAAHERSAVVGTNGTRIAGEEVASSLTTPEAPALHALFAVMVEEGVSGCAMEVSSHALVMGRVDGVVFDVAAFTNLGRDHLDFHADLEDYFSAKAQLFTPARSRLGLVNLDDPYGRRLLDEASIPMRTFSRDAAAGADWWVDSVVPTPTGARFVLHGPSGELPVEVPLPGDFNVTNAMCAVASLAEAGYDAAAVAAAMARGGGVAGRMEPVAVGQDFTAVVDYAHKPDAVEAVLSSVRASTDGRVIMVIGAGGDRDRGKRRVMGAIAARLADVVVVTDDNPRTEDPAAIRRELFDGAGQGVAELHEEGDRRAAIRLAVGLAGAGDCLVVAGKGHETGQEIAGVVHPFDDREELRAALREAEGVAES
jgi:UDP-N-acetylmuramoyl-L-alanyl-D-glutamate--2,6-diaminopimelate ligase